MLLKLLGMPSGSALSGAAISAVLAALADSLFFAQKEKPQKICSAAFAAKEKIAIILRKRAANYAALLTRDCGTKSSRTQLPATLIIAS